jgi:two-component system phosphate regulon sensor histidine kinase PhoR
MSARANLPSMDDRYRQLADAMPQIVWTADASGAANYFNWRWFEYTGMTPEEAGPNAWQLVVHPDDLPSVIARREQTLKSGETFETEYRFRRADGRYRWHLGRAVPLRAADGSIELWVGTATDIDDRKRIEHELEARAQAARVLATIGDGVFLIDRSGDVCLWNNAAESITGLREAEVLGRPASAALPGWEGVEALIPVASSGEPARAESIPFQFGARELWLSISAVGDEDGTVYAFRDLTDERALESMRQDLVATVSHELRTPLAAIYGSALTLRRGDVALDLDLRNQLLDVIAEESDSLANIVNDLLLASQLDSGKLKANVERCDPREIARAVIDAARAHLPDGVQLELSAEDELPAVAADSGQLRQVLSNLIENAIKYSPDGGTIAVALEPGDRHVRFAITDAGLGIPPAEQQRIFQKFYRLDPHMSRGIGGTGLGLYICRELVRRVDGRIWVESDGSAGSTFFVEIPEETPAPAATSSQRRVPSIA